MEKKEEEKKRSQDLKERHVMQTLIAAQPSCSRLTKIKIIQKKNKKKKLLNQRLRNCRKCWKYAARGFV